MCAQVVFTPSSPYLFWPGALGGRIFCRELWFMMLPLPSIIHSLWFLSNLSLIVLVQLKRQSEFLLHHQYNLQLISIWVHYHAPFGFSSTFINNKNNNWGLFVHACVFACVCWYQAGSHSCTFSFQPACFSNIGPSFVQIVLTIAQINFPVHNT